MSAVTVPDQQLIDECRAGRTEAFGQLVVRYQDRLYHTLVTILGSAEDARDVAQEAFVHAYRKLGTFQGKSAFYSWLFRIAMNLAVSHKRKNSRKPASIDFARVSGGVEPADGHPEVRPSHGMEVSERQIAVKKALAEIPEDLRAALVLKEIEGLKYEEIAEIVNCPVGTVRSRIHRARNELREKLRGLLDEV